MIASVAFNAIDASIYSDAKILSEVMMDQSRFKGDDNLTCERFHDLLPDISERLRQNAHEKS